MSDETLTLDVNGSRYELNEEFKSAIEQRARLEYKDNFHFSCWWTEADPDDYDDDRWDTLDHDEGDPLLIIETEGPIVPWDNLDELSVNIEQVDNQTGGGDYHQNETEESDTGDGTKTLPPDTVEQEGESLTEENSDDRTHFTLTPKKFEEVPQPEGEDADKLPPKPIEMGNDPALVLWVPEHPDIEERWSTGEAIVPTDSWVEWNIQSKVDQPRLTKGDSDTHDHWESLLELRECEKVGEYTTSQDTPSDKDEPSGQVKREGKDSFENGKFGGDNWGV